MKCDICGKTDFQEGECVFMPPGENKHYCSDCRQQAETDGTASWLPKNRNKPNNFPWLWVFLIIIVIVGIGLVVWYYSKTGWKCRNCGMLKASCNCPLIAK